MKFSEKLNYLKQEVESLAIHQDSTDEIYRACMGFLRELERIEIVDKAYQLHCEFFGDGAMEYEDFVSHQSNHALCVYFAKKLMELGVE